MSLIKYKNMKKKETKGRLFLNNSFRFEKIGVSPELFGLYNHTKPFWGYSGFT